MFDDIVARPQAVRPRRSRLLLVSLAAHGVAIGAAVVTAVAAPDTLPFPRRVFAYVEPVAVKLADIELAPTPKARPPAPRRAGTAPTRPAATLTAVEAAPTPLVPPTGVSPETGREGLVPPAGAGDGRGDPRERAEAAPVSALPPEPPAPAAARLHSGIRAPRKIVDVAPVYPVLARSSHVEGVVILDATIDSEGRVADVRVLRSVTLLDQAALEAVRRWQFEPARLNGQAIPVVMTITVRFALGR